MRRTLVPALAVAAALLVPTAVRADSPDLIQGGCGLPFDDIVTGDDHTGVISDTSQTLGADGLPTDATVSCWLEINLVEVPGTRFSYSGYGAQAGADRVSFVASPGDRIDVCQSAAFADGTTQRICPPVQNLIFPPDNVQWLLNFAFDRLDPGICPQLAALAGSYPGGVTIGPDGDVYVPDPLALLGGPVYDCPPYGDFWDTKESA